MNVCDAPVRNFMQVNNAMHSASLNSHENFKAKKICLSVNWWGTSEDIKTREKFSCVLKNVVPVFLLQSATLNNPR